MWPFGMASRRAFGSAGQVPILVDPRVTFKLEKLAPPVIRPYMKKFPPRFQLSLHGPLGTVSVPLYEGFSLREEPLQYSTSVLENTSKNIVLPNRKCFVTLDMEAYKNMPKFQKEFTEQIWGTTASHIRNLLQGVTEVNQVF